MGGGEDPGGEVRRRTGEFPALAGHNGRRRKIMEKQMAHITIRGLPLCEVMGGPAFGMYTCDYLSTSEAQKAAKALRSSFARGVVRVVAGACPNAK
jgi:hypothetical protein